MSKIRIHQLAKDLDVPSKDMITKLHELGVDVVNHMSALEDEDVKKIKDIYSKKPVKTEAKPAAKPAAKPVAKPVAKPAAKPGAKTAAKPAAKTAPKPATKPRSLAKPEKKKKKGKGKGKGKRYEEEVVIEEVIIEEEVEKVIIEGPVEFGEKATVSEFATKIGQTPNDVILKLMNRGVMATMNHEVDFETLEVIASEFGIELVKVVVSEELFEFDFEDDEKDLVKRPPVVTVMGHVDHGKTSLLDAIRNTAVTDREAGGITQHIGASEVMINDEKIVFLDTPGHEAFTSLRARGAQVTDIAILVVAADDGVMPQTIEAIDHARAAGVPIVIAINKIDKANANPDRVKQELSEKGLLIEEWGGDVVSCDVSALKGEGIDNLLEMVILVAEMLELKANPNRVANGTIIEAKVDKGRGTVATIIVQNGTLNVGDAFIAGATYGRVKAMFNDHGKRIKKAGPSTSVEILGLNDMPQAGDKFYVMKDEKAARSMAEKRQIDVRALGLKSSRTHVTLEDLFSQIQEGNIKDLNIILKTDVHGSLEALKGSLNKLTNEEVRINIIHASIGTITESDILLASASNAIIIGFNVRPSSGVSSIAKEEQVDLRTYRIIYDAINEVEQAMTGLLDPEFKEVVLGKIEVRMTFKVPNMGLIAGGYVLEGKVTRNSSVRLIREGIVVHEGKISSLRRFKDDAKEVLTGFECGIGLEKYNDLKEGDIIEAFVIEEIKRVKL